MKNAAAAFFIFFLTTVASAQNIPTSCFKIGGWDVEYMVAAVPTYDGNYVMAGQTHTWNHGGDDADFYVVKCDLSGNIIWTHSEGTNAWDYTGSIVETSDHSLVLVGENNADLIMIKYAADGTQLWSKTIDVIDFEQTTDIIQTFEGGYLICGESDISLGTKYATLIKVDADGNLIWNKNYTSGFDAFAFAVTETADHRYIVAGQIVGFPTSSFAFCVNTGGNLVWEKYTPHQWTWYDAITTSDSDVVMVGYNYTSDNDAPVIKLTTNGDTVWSRSFGGGSLFHIFYSVTAAPDGGLVMAGKAYNFDTTYGYVVKCDGNGQLQWSRAFDDAKFFSVHAMADGGFVVCGERDGDMYFVKLDADGNSCPDCPSIPYGSEHGGFGIRDTTFTEYIQQATISPITLSEQTGGDATIFCNEVGVEETANESLELKIFPDPVDDYFTVKNFTSNNSRADLFVMDEEGRIVMKVLSNESSSGRNIDVNASSLPSSTYLIVLRTSVQIQTQKFVVQH